MKKIIKQTILFTAYTLGCISLVILFFLFHQNIHLRAERIIRRVDYVNSSFLNSLKNNHKLNNDSKAINDGDTLIVKSSSINKIILQKYPKFHIKNKLLSVFQNNRYKKQKKTYLFYFTHYLKRLDNFDTDNQNFDVSILYSLKKYNKCNFTRPPPVFYSLYI